MAQRVETRARPSENPCRYRLLATNWSSSVSASFRLSTTATLGMVMPKSVILTPAVASPLTDVSPNWALISQVTGCLTRAR
jgi:hypothetical protein